MIPEGLDATSLQYAMLGVTGMLAMLALTLFRIVRKAMVRMVLIGLIGAVIVSMWLHRPELQACLETCSCRLFGQPVTIPQDKNPYCDVFEDPRLTNLDWPT